MEVYLPLDFYCYTPYNLVSFYIVYIYPSPAALIMISQATSKFFTCIHPVSYLTYNPTIFTPNISSWFFMTCLHITSISPYSLENIMLNLNSCSLNSRWHIAFSFLSSTGAVVLRSLLFWLESSWPLGGTKVKMMSRPFPVSFAGPLRRGKWKLWSRGPGNAKPILIISFCY